MTNRHRPDNRFALLPGIGVLRRPDGDLQIGTEPPRWVVLRHPPPHAETVLSGLDGTDDLEAVCRRTGTDPALWTDLVDELCRQGLAERVDAPFPTAGRWDGPDAERLSTALRRGTRHAGRVLGARSDAGVLLIGEGGTHRRLLEILPEVGVGRVVEGRPPTVPNPRRSPRGPWWQLDDEEIGRRAPDLVVVTDQPLSPWSAADLHTATIAHLAVRTGPWGSTIGPLTLPGRSACPRCVTRRRSAVDDGWPLVEVTGWRHPGPASPLAQSMTATIVAGEILDLLDGTVAPATVGGTVEWVPGSWSTRRRSWPVQPGCECVAVSARIGPGHDGS